MKDQAEKLRERMTMSSQSKTKIVTVTSGKGGVGKSNVSLNFALSLIKQGKKVLILDVDLGLANIDVLMGVSPRRTLMQMIEQQLSIWDVIEKGPEGILFISGGSGFQHLFQLDERKMARFFEEMSAIQGHVDYIILDTGAGLSQESLRFLLAADEVILVTVPEPTALTDAYAVLKMVTSKDPKININLVVNRSTSDKEGEQTAKKLTMVAQQFLNKTVSYLGHIPDDPAVTKSVKKQVPFLIAHPDSKAAKAMINLSRQFLQYPSEHTGGIVSFLKRMVGRA